MGRRLGDVIADCLARATRHGISATMVTKPDGECTCESSYEWYRRSQDEVATWAKAQGRGRTVRILADVDTIITGLYSRMASLRVIGFHMVLSRIFGLSLLNLTPYGRS